MPLRAVFIDAGNTLLYEKPSRFEIYALAARRRGLDLSAERMTDLMRQAHRELPREIDGAFRYSEGWFSSYIERIFHEGLDLSRSELPAVRDELFARFADPRTFHLFPGGLELLEALRRRGLAVGVISNWSQRLPALRRAVGRRFLGHAQVVEELLVALLAQGHVLLEGAPGLGKTTLAKSLAAGLDLSFGRIQCTPDLMPADVLGSRILEESARDDRRFVFHRGPIFCHVLLADEINRATPRTQSALLEAMQERQVTVFGETHALEDPFFVVATQNPIEMECTYPLPEAQLDRFLLKVELRSPAARELSAILAGTIGPEPQLGGPALARERLLRLRGLAREVPASSDMVAFVTRLLLPTHPGEVSAP